MRPLLQWGNNKYYVLGVSVCGLRHPACNAQASYCHLWPVRLYSSFPTLSNKRHHFLTWKLLDIKRVFWFSVQFVSDTFRILRRTERDVIINVCWCLCKVLVILVKFQWSLNFLDRLSKNSQISNFLKNRSVRAELFHADGRTNRQMDRRDNANSHSSPFCFRS